MNPAGSCGCCGAAARGRCYLCAAVVATRRCTCRCEGAGPVLPPSPAQALGVISLLQPWATCMIPGPKDTENRIWAAPLPDYGGRWFGLHAALRFDSGVVAPPQQLVRDHLHALWPGMPAFEKMPTGALLGVIHVSKCEPVDHTDASPWASGPIGWRVDYKIALREPVRAKGAQRIWFATPGDAGALWRLFPRPLDPPPAQPTAA